LSLASLVACRPGPPSASPTAAPPATATPSPAPTVAPTATPTPLPEGLVLLVQSEATEIASALQPIAEAHGLVFRTTASLDGLDVIPRVVVALDAARAAALAADWPRVPFVALGEGEGAENLILVQRVPDAERPAFLAGYLAALVTQDWRTGVVAADQAVIDAFTNGVAYFCGLCRPVYPPFYEYPRYVLLPSPDADPTTALQALVDKGVQTVYLPFDLSASQWQMALQAVPDVQVIGVGAPPTEDLRWRWVASVGWGTQTALAETVEAVLAGKDVPPTVTPPLEIVEVNSQRLSPGRRADAERLIPDLLSGAIVPLTP